MASVTAVGWTLGFRVISLETPLTPDRKRTASSAALRSYRQGVGTYTDLATEENAVVQGDTQVEDARANAHTAAAALALSMGAIDIAGVQP